jgi:hypothetical protein
MDCGEWLQEPEDQVCALSVTTRSYFRHGTLVAHRVTDGSLALTSSRNEAKASQEAARNTIDPVLRHALRTDAAT